MVLRAIKRFFSSYLFWAAVAVALGVLSLYYNPLIVKPQVGVIKIDDDITSRSTEDIVTMFRYAKDERAIKAVVLDIDSPGGSAVASEEVYLNVLRLKKTKPVVAVINAVGASGAYYVAVAADHIYAKPTSMVGSIGVWAQLAEPEEVDEDVITSGPFKATGGSRRSVVGQIEMIKEAFIRAVVSSRAERLKLSAEEVGKAQVYIGIEALRYGLVDEIGSSTDAIDKAAGMAGIKRYDVTDIREELGLTSSVFWWPFSKANSIDPTRSQSSSDALPKFFYLYIEPK